MPNMTCGLVERAQTIPDPRRQSRNRKHLLEDVVVIGFCAVLAGCDDFVEIADWAKRHFDFLASFLQLPHGIPAHDTFNRVFAMLKPDVLQQVLLPWLIERRGLPGDLVHLDGKTMRRTASNAKNLKALHVVSAWAGQAGLTLGQVAVDAKSNEITAMPELLRLLDLRQKVVTIDAMGCQKEIVQTIVDQEGDYVIAVKDNQPTLHAEVQAAFATAISQGNLPHRACVCEERGHGREERRCVEVLPAKGNLSAKLLECWAGLVTLVMVVREVTNLTTGMTTEEVSYFISSVRPNARRVSEAIRGHWRIENGLHWVLDVVFREDARRVYDRTAADNVAFLNRLALSVLRGDQSIGSLKVKRKRAGWSVQYLAQLLGFPSI